MCICYIISLRLRFAVDFAGQKMDINFGWTRTPAMGIERNSHFSMMDDKSDVVWQMVSDWLRRL